MTLVFAKIGSYHWFLGKTSFCRQTFAIIAENCDHNIDPLYHILTKLITDSMKTVSVFLRHVHKATPPNASLTTATATTTTKTMKLRLGR
jgi:hypothetical protein